MLRITYSIRYLEQAIAKLQAMQVEIVKRCTAWSYAEGLEVLAFSQKIVPVDTGALKSSGFVEEPRVRGGVIECRVGYGGPAAGYALDVHENLEMKHDSGEEPKFLEKGLLSREKAMIENLNQVLQGLGA